jgi:hypothetical protein
MFVFVTEDLLGFSNSRCNSDNVMVNIEVEFDRLGRSLPQEVH